MSKQKYALVTGSSSGIGYNVCIALSKRGYKVFGASLEHTLPLMDPLQKEWGVVPVACDITNNEDIRKTVEYIKKETNGKLHLLYNNAGIAVGAPAIEQPADDLEKVFRVNVFGHMYMTQYMSDLVIAAKGTIVFTSSIAARVPLPWISAYCSTKAAIDQYALVLHGEMEPFGVRVHSVITGGVNTAIGDNSCNIDIGPSRYNVDGIIESTKASSGMTRDPRTHVSPESYAENVVRCITRKRDPGFNIYQGGFSYIMHFVGRWFPLFLTEWILQFQFKQLKVWRNIRKQVKAKDEAELRAKKLD
ncbi:uncharacterized protein PRCAT00002863001 [Priceomyces carsonii]|uniref:uncharacterized protein n=1 Tax=Priceomyces carsonii TaxID=28549 RepID=UPI002EDB01AD|nr:unnamed protein product [Priceomyces carsonii]